MRRDAIGGLDRADSVKQGFCGLALVLMRPQSTYVPALVNCTGGMVLTVSSDQVATNSTAAQIRRMPSRASRWLSTFTRTSFAG